MHINRADLDNAVKQGLIDASQAEPLWQYFNAQGVRQARFQLSHLLYYLGGLIAISALSIFVTWAWELLGGWGLLLIAVFYIVLALALTEYLLQRQLPVPAGLTAALAVALTPLAVYGLQKSLGFWPDAAIYKDYHDFISWRWILMELATLAVGAILLWRYRLPFLIMPVAVTLWYMSMDLVPFLFSFEFTWELRRDFSLWFGLLMLMLAFGVDLRFGRRPDFAFWLYLFGMLAFWCGLSLRDSDSELAKFGYCLLNIMLLLLGTALRRRVFVVFGGCGIALYLGYLANEVFQDSLLFPVVLSFIGLGIIGLGILWQKYQEQLGQTLRQLLPQRLQQVIAAGD
ncbi:MAG: DUF2157 domain-containing protein [Candidatus Competibacteraceae bacterium]|nr:DUF2157 domain-containing protein [Candidatus Competibacteraceae bacterium]MCB1809604.1 DUF2157 domain-containing protein [Candidatus Competibacteraceae bacterium]